MDDKERKNLSKFLSYTLRHHPELIGLAMDENGWADVDELIFKSAQAGRIFQKSDLEEIVATNDKKRFLLIEDKSRIRASQGHSVNINLNLQAQTPPAILYHGTVEKSLESIRQEGLQKMSRQHVHLSTDKATAVNVGGRHGKPIILVIDTAGMDKAGFTFYLSDNGVWLTDNVPPAFITF
ncbi:MAG: RNA 2'-phosphotransferase [Gemmatimonadaceae bacterium]|nr:RNA 2'-phosphotransferase [Chitinophagaceae bacterium]